MPPASKRFLANDARAVWTAGGPSVTRHTSGRRPCPLGDPVGPAALAFERLGVADRPQRLEGRAIDLLLGRQRRRRHLADVGELGHAGQRVAPVGDGVGPGVAHSGHAVLHQTGAQRLDDAARPFELLELSPRRPGQLVGEVFHVPRPAGGVDDPGEVGLLDEHELRIAGEAATRRRSAGDDELVVRSHRHGVGAPDPGGEAGDRVAQHVDPRVVARGGGP